MENRKHNKLKKNKKGEKMKRETEFARINQLEKLARDYRRKAISDEDIEQNDITDIVLNELPSILKNEIFNMSINGKTRSSKSTLMIWFLNYILTNLMNEKLELWHICAEQFEFVRKVMDHNIHDTIMGIDEYGAMEESGANATIEQKMLEQFSDLQAQRQIHRIYCSPRSTIDRNSNIMIKIMAKDTDKLTTHCLVYYKVEAPNEWYIQLIGRMSINISDIMFTEKSWKQFEKDYQKDINQKETIGQNWEKIKEKYKLKEFEMTMDEKGKEHQPYGTYQHEIYHRYRKRKFLKMQLLNKHGIAHMRDMVFADITLHAYNKLEGLCGITPITKDNIESKINQKLREIKYPLTIYAMEVVKSNVASLISDKKTIQQLKISLIKKKMGEDRTRIQTAIDETQKSLNEGLNEVTNLIIINKEYNSV